MATAGEMWTQVGSAIASIMFIHAMVQQYFPYDLRPHFQRYRRKMFSFLYPYIEITFHEFSGERFKRSAAYAAIENYLATSSSRRAKRLKADVVEDSGSIILSMDSHEEIADEFQGTKVWWSFNKQVPKAQLFSFYPNTDEKRFYSLSFHRRHRDLVTGSYVNHVLKEGKAIASRNRQRKLYTNNSSTNWSGYKRNKWSHVPFEHPATFATLALDPKKKDEIIRDLDKFRRGKEYYAKIGKAWKRGYLLYGPPGTGKSTMIAAMANHLSYDVYDLELTAVKNNTELRNLLIETSDKSIIIIEDIDCSLDLTGQRKKKKQKSEGEEEDNPATKMGPGEGDEKDSKVTLSGLLNFIDGIWSACVGERLIVFTTNYLEKLEPALIRRGRMDKHIQLSYCRYEAFKVLAKNYLDVDSHELFATVGRLLEETDMTPADVAENLMPKSDDDGPEECLRSLVEALQVAKEEAAKKAREEEEARLEAEKKKTEEGEGGKTENGKSNSDEVKENGVLEAKAE